MPVSTSHHASATKAAAALAIERPRHECLFPQLAQPTTPTPLPVAPRELSRCNYSEPLLASSFGKAASSRAGPSAGNSPHLAASGLSAATTAFVVASQARSRSEAPCRSEVGLPKNENAIRQEDLSEEAGADAACGGTQSEGLQALLPYRASPASSLVSGWRPAYSADVGKSTALARGLRKQDVRFCTANSPGVCVLRQKDEVPKIPGINCAAILSKQAVVDSITKQLLELGVPLTDLQQRKSAIASSVSREDVVGSFSDRRLSGREARASSASSLHGHRGQRPQ